MTQAPSKAPNPDVPPNLVSTWIAIEADNGRIMADALRELNETCNTNYRQSIIRSWERGEKAPGRRVYSYMLKRVMPTVLKEHGVRRKDLDLVLEKILMPEPDE